MKKTLKHGTEAVKGGKLRGATDQTDYFYFFCPKCDGEVLLRVLDYTVLKETEKNSYDGEELKSKCKKGFTLKFEVFCEKCNHFDIVKISNEGLQGGNHSNYL